MDLSNFVVYNRQESLLLNIAKSNLQIEKNTSSKPQETLEFEMNKQRQEFKFDIPLILEDSWLMGVTNLQVYNTIYNITPKNNKLKIYILDSQLKEYGVDLEIASKIENIYTYFFKDVEDVKEYNKSISNIIDLINNSQKLIQDDYIRIKKVVEKINNDPNKPLINIKFPVFYTFQNEIEIEITPGIYELEEINEFIKHEILIRGFRGVVEFSIEVDIKSMKSIINSSNPFYFNSDLNLLFGFIEKEFSQGIYKSEKTIMLLNTDKVYLKCDCIDGSILNGRREQILFSFDLNTPPGYKIIEKPTTILYKKINKNRLDYITFYLEDSNNYPVDFNGETLNFTIQIIKI